MLLSPNIADEMNVIFDNYVIYFGRMLSPSMASSDRLYLDDVLMKKKHFIVIFTSLVEVLEYNK